MIGTPRVHHRTIDSTNARARELAASGAPHGTLVTADEQTAGRGRQGRSWTAPRGRALLMSLVIRELDAGQALLPLAAAVAVCEGCEAMAPVACTIKWPNDVWIERRKVAGILIEGRPAEGWAVLGIGLNVSTTEEEFPPELRGSATSLMVASGISKLDPEKALGALLPALEARLSDTWEALLERWRRRDALQGEAVRWAGGEGVAAGVGDEGSLLVDTREGRITLDAGEVHLRR